VVPALAGPVFVMPSAGTFSTRWHLATVHRLKPGLQTVDSDQSQDNPPEPVPIPIEGELDLHTFNPRDIKELLPAYLAACREKGIFQVRVVHGKGVGNLRRTVHAILSRLPEVVSYSLATEHFGGWGATIVNLRRERQ